MTGLFGGAFDPPHTGHLALARRARAHFGLDRLIVLPTGTASHKRVETDPEVRFHLASLAFAGMPGVEVSRWEIDRDGPSYTLATVRHWPGSIFLLGADEFADFLDWHEPHAILEHARLGVATRTGFPRERLEPVLTRLARPERVELFELQPIPVSSRDLRARAGRGESLRGLVPPAVADEIERSGLYRMT